MLCLGLMGAGKSTALATLVGEPSDALEPTTGFNIKTLPVNDTVLNIKELGGGLPLAYLCLPGICLKMVSGKTATLTDLFR